MVKPEPKGVYSIRLSEGQLKLVDEFVENWHSAHYSGSGFSGGEPPVLNRAQVIQWALDEGLMVLDGKVKAAFEKRKKAAPSEGHQAPRRLVVDFYAFGKRRVKVFPTKRAADDFAADQARQRRQRIKPAIDAHVTLEAFVPTFLDRYRAMDIKPKTLERYEGALRVHIAPLWAPSA